MSKESTTDKIVAVTGGAGFIGSHLCDKLLASEPKKIIIMDDLSLGKMRNIKHSLKNTRVKMYKLDVSDYYRMVPIFKEEHIDIVFNLAVVPESIPPKAVIYGNPAKATRFLKREGKARD